jgi:alcohol dehydrogenase class IV/GMP synthase-like glutamine amidotransferase
MSPVLRGNWNYPTTIWAGPGRIAELAAACASAGIKRPLIVTDEGLTAAPMIKNALAALKDAALFGGVRGNPASSHVDAGLRAYRAGNHDGVVAFGGGSALDAGKVVAFMSGQTRPLWDFEDIGDWWTRADPAGIAPVVAVPTTAGTGSEVGRAGVILNEETHQKKIIFHPRMMPHIVISDPELTVGLPRAVTAATGIDAFVHCFEAFCAPGFHPLADGVALEGMRLIHRYLPRVCADGRDIEARAYMLAAASMGATAFQKGLGGVHAIAHPVGSWFNTHHGLTNAVILPYVMRFNRAAISDKAEVIARVLDLPARGFDGFFTWVLDMRRELGIPHSHPRRCRAAGAYLPRGGGRPARGRGSPDMTGPRILIIDGNVAEIRARQVAALGYDSGTGYARVLHRVDPTLRIDIVTAADGATLSPGAALESYDGVTMTGSALNIYNGGAPVTRQIELAKAVLAAGIPFFGSCWGLQVAVTAAGGEVRANPRGREFGFGRRILLSDAGRAHPLFAGKPPTFEAPTIHRDEIASLPTGATTLAANDFGLQAASFTHGRGTFWGVQYHPEYDYVDIVAAAERYGQTLVTEGMFRDTAALASFAADLRALQANPSDGTLLWKYGLGAAMRTETLRLTEIRNWLQLQVQPRTAGNAQ